MIKSKDNDKGLKDQRSQGIEGTSLQRRQRQRSQELNDKSNLIDLMKECHNELTSGEIVSLKILSRTMEVLGHLWMKEQLGSFMFALPERVGCCSRVRRLLSVVVAWIQGHRQEEGIDYDEVFAPVARLEAIRIFLAFASYMGFIVYQMDVKSAFLYGKIDEEMSSMGELTFFLGLQVKQKSDGIFISQDKYVAEILKKFDFASVKTASTPIETQKPLVKDEEASDVDVHLYRSMIGSLMYVTASRPDIMFAVCACSRFQVTPKTSHLSAVKRIFRYLKGKPKLGLWYPRESSFDLESYSDSDYAGANLDRKSTTGGCQFLGRRLITWQCKKQTIVATSTTEAEYVAAASCCGQVLWIQNQMLDYGFNFMNTKIYIDNESTICIVKNPVYHSKTKHIAIRHHFIRDAYEKKLIQVLKIHTNDNVADLLTKAFDAALESCPKHKLIRLLEKTAGNVEFHEVIDFLQRSYIYHALTIQAKEIIILKAQSPSSRRQAKPVINISKAISEDCLIAAKTPREELLLERNLGCTISLITLITLETENAQSEGRTREMVDEDKEIDEVRLSTEDVVSTDKEGVSTDFEKSKEKVLKIKVESTVGHNRSYTYPQHESSKAASKEKEKGVELKDVEEIDRPRPTSTRSLLTLKPLPKIYPKDKGKKKIEEEDESESEDEDISQAVKKFKQLESDEEMARKIQEEWEKIPPRRESEENTRKEKAPVQEKMKSRKRRFKQDTSQDDPSDSEKENDELRLCLTIAPDEDKEVDYEILDKKYPIID
ncbi:putative ribonuclease H-like domain-containing protein [Tanacetum coccineum]